MLEAPGRRAAAPDEPVPGAGRRARIPPRSDRPGHPRTLCARAGAVDQRSRPARERIRSQRGAAAPRRRRHRDRADALPRPRARRRRLRSSGFAAIGTRRRLACSRTRRWWSSRGSSPSSCPRIRGTCSPAGPSRCSTRFARAYPAPSSRGRRRWRAATAPATAAWWSARGGTCASASTAPSCGRRMTPILNASGCLDALTAPGVAHSLDAFVTKTVTPLPREGNPPPRIAETDARDAELDRAAEPGNRGVRRRAPAAARELGVPVWVSVGGFSAADYAESARGWTTATTSRRSS